MQKVDHIGDQVQDVKSSVDDLKKDVKSRVDDLKAMMTRVDVLVATSADMPIPPKIFIGRDAVVNEIADHLASGDITRSRVFILAPGGMGKTSTALAVMKHPSVTKKFAKERQFWVPCISANSPSTFLAHLSRYLRVKRQTGHPLDDILATLKTTKDPLVILLDNFETPWNLIEVNQELDNFEMPSNPIEDKQESVSDVLRALALLPHVAILGTMRSEFPPLDEWIQWIDIRLSHVEPQDAQQIYTAIDPRAGNDPKLDELLHVLGHLPYAVTLMATLGKRSLSSPEKLLRRWNETGTDMLSKGQGGMDHSIELSLQFVPDSTNARELLQVLSMLPAGLELSHLDFWFPDWKPEAVKELREAALVLVIAEKVGTVQEDRLFVIPVVQSYMHQRNRIPGNIRQRVYDATCDFLDLYKSPVNGPNDPKFKCDVAAIGAQVINIQALLTEIIHDETGTRGQLQSPSVSSVQVPPSDKPSTQPKRLDALLTFAWYQRWTKPDIIVAKDALTLAESGNDAQRIAEAVFCLGSILEEQHHYQEGGRRFDEAKDLFVALKDDFRAFRSEMESMMAAMSHSGPSEQLLSQTLSRWNTPHSADISAFILFYSGQVHFNLMRAKEALEELQEAKTLLVKLNYRYEAARCLLRTAKCFAVLGEYDRALEVVNESIQRYEDLGMLDDLVFLNKSRYLKGGDIWGDELSTTLQTALERSRELGKPVHIALILVEFGEMYVHRKEWAAARLKYREAIKELDGFSDHTTSRVLANTENNLLYIEAQETNRLDSSVEFRPPRRF